MENSPKSTATCVEKIPGGHSNSKLVAGAASRRSQMTARACQQQGGGYRKSPDPSCGMTAGQPPSFTDLLRSAVMHDCIVGSDASFRGMNHSLNIGDNTEIDYS